ncbi:ComF family protein [Variovorax sp. OV329]|uniref:ComF family protein n=1 Tax=Variovorax sp. OV329 TaxID=1882825 RepID=UPI0008E9D615|nr:ComF family protein [Variovorax sp. OV329]SFM76260.1 comF family protein [Variovorax sp. OV329]
MPALAFLSQWRDRLPGVCAVCASWPARPVCDACVARFAPPVPRCRSCALPVPEDVARCGECLRHPPPLDACLACCDYAWPWPGRIGRFKFQGEAGWATPLATLIRSMPWVEPVLEQADLVLPMPLSAQRLKSRGFNQALELARQLSPRKMEARLLLRTRDTPPQSGLPRAQRLTNLRGAFALEPLRAHEARGRRVVLVDDVMTSGASLFAAAQVLRDAGAAHVAGIVFARTGRPDAARAP